MHKIRLSNLLHIARCMLLVLLFSLGSVTTYAEDRAPVRPASSDLTYNLLVGFIAFESEKYDLAATHFLSAAQVRPNVSIAEYAMRSALLADDKANALAAGKLWSRIDNANPVSIEFRIRAYSRLAEVEPAIDELERLRQLSVADGYNGFLPLLPLLFRDPSNLISIKLMQGLVERHKHNVYAHFALADLAMRFRLHELALSSSRWALQIQPDFSPAVMQYATSLQFLNRADEALKYLYQHLVDHPDQENVRSYYARLLDTYGHPLESYGQYLKLAEANSANEDYIYALAKMAYRLEDYDAAWRYYLELVVRGSRGEEAKLMLGKIDEINGKPEKAISWYAAIGPSQFFFDGQKRAAQLLAKSGRFDAALTTVKKMQEQNPVGHFTDLLLLEGSILVSANRHRDAYDLYTSYFDGPPRRHAELLYARALLARDMGDNAAYYRDLEHVLLIDEEHQASLVEIAKAFVDQAKYDEALLYLQRAVDLYPDDSRALADYGWLQKQLGRLPTALSYLERAAEIDDDPIIFVYLGETQREMGYPDKARLTWHRGLAKSPENKQLISLIRSH